MEAMTIMGMAASQARFLGLTARKSNVEYQGQQINQQRTALSNESANLYQQMMNLTVPTPPQLSQFTKIEYTLEDSSGSYDMSDYKIEKLIKTYNAQNEYKVSLSSLKEVRQRDNSTFRVSKPTITPNTSTPGSTYAFSLYDNAGSAYSLIYNEDDTNAYTGDNDSLQITTNQIYAINPNPAKAMALTGYDECKDINPAYFYQDKNGKNYFLTADDLNTMKNSTGQVTDAVTLASTHTYEKTVTTEVTAKVETSSSGRYSSIIIDENDDYPANLSGATYSISATQVENQAEYDEAYNDYKYQQDVYNKAIADINAQTEIIQKEDQQLELRLQQLNTEQDAIKTEMDSVSKVIEDNVEKTFKVFA